MINSNARDSRRDKTATGAFSVGEAGRVRRFHRSLPGYEPSPLATLTNLARRLGIADIRMKDESYRFGLNAFKALGATHAAARILAERLNLRGRTLSFALFDDPRIRKTLGEITFVTATDGNHGRAVAWAAQQLGCRAVVFMPGGSAPVRLEAIRSHGAEASVIEGNYDDAVHLAAREAEKRNWILLQDSSREGYEEVPRWVMQGYLTMVDEALEQLGDERPTHVFVQCGVGSFGASVQAHFAEIYGPERPIFGVVEPVRAACLYKSMSAGDGIPRKVGGALDTIMVGLACGEPSKTAWEILRDYTDFFLTVSDDVTMKGMRALGNPLPGDDRVVSGESGAVCLGFLVTLLSDPALRETALALKLDSRSRVLLFSTEGNTDPGMYRRILGDRRKE